MACHLFVMKPMLPHYELDLKEHMSEILFNIQMFSLKKMHLKMMAAILSWLQCVK